MSSRRGHDVSARAWAVAGTVLWLVAAPLGCIGNLPIEGTICPCPSGYSCVHDPSGAVPRCQVTRAGDGDASSPSDAGSVLAAADGHQEAAVEARDGASISDVDAGDGPATSLIQVSSDDEIVVGFTASGDYLVTLGTPSMGSTNVAGLVTIHDLQNGHATFKASFATASLDTVAISPSGDAILGPGFYWTPLTGFQMLGTDAASPDGRFVTSTANLSSYRVIHVGMSGPIALAVKNSDAMLFSPDDRFLFISDSAPGGTKQLIRVDTMDDAAPEMFSGGGIDSGLVPGASPFGPDDTAIFAMNGSVWAWHPSDSAPTVLVSSDKTASSFGPNVTGLAGDWLFFSIVPPDSTDNTQINERVALSTGQTDVLFSMNDVLSLIPAPGGDSALIAAWNGGGWHWSVARFPSGEMLTWLPYIPDKTLGYHFTPDSKWVYGRNWPSRLAGTVLGDLTVADAISGVVRTLDEGTVPQDPQIVPGDRLALVRSMNDSKYAGSLPIHFGDLVVKSIASESETILASGVDEFIAVSDRRVAFSRHDAGAVGIYLVEVPQ